MGHPKVGDRVKSKTPETEATMSGIVTGKYRVYNTFVLDITTDKGIEITKSPLKFWEVEDDG